MSLGRPGSVDDNPDLHDLIISLEGAGITVVVAAGNDPSLDASNRFQLVILRSLRLRVPLRRRARISVAS